jgi:hypothetical protein
MGSLKLTPSAKKRALSYLQNVEKDDHDITTGEPHLILKTGSFIEATRD